MLMYYLIKNRMLKKNAVFIVYVTIRMFQAMLLANGNLNCENVIFETGELYKVAIFTTILHTTARNYNND